MLTTVFGVLVFVALAIALATRDWRLKAIAAAYSAVWLTTLALSSVEGLDLVPLLWINSAYTIFIFLLSFCIQARGEYERRVGEPLASWLLVPMFVEGAASVSYLTDLLWSLPLQWQLMQAGFAAELICLIIVGGRRLDLVGRVRRGANALASWIRTAPRPA